MSTATRRKRQDSTAYVEFDEFVDYQLERTRDGIRLTDLVTAVVGVLAFVLAYVLVFVVLDHWVVPGGFGFGTRVALLSVVVLASAAWFGSKVIVPWMRKVNELYAARVIETSEPGLRNLLLSLVDLRNAGRPVAPEVLASLQRRAALSLSQMDVEHVVDKRPLLRLSYVLLALVVACSLYTVFSPKKISNSVWRALFPVADIAVATQTEIVAVRPGDTEVVFRSPVDIEVDLGGHVPEHVRLLYSTADRRFVDEVLEMQPATEGLKQFRAVLRGDNGQGVRQDMTYRIEAGDAVSREFRIVVKQPPSASVEEVEYRYPEYTGLEPRTRPDGAIEAWERTVVTVRARANMPLRSAVVQFADDESFDTKAEEIAMRVEDGGLALSANWTLAFRESDGTAPRFYRVLAKAPDGEIDPRPTVHPLRILPDPPPAVALVHPKVDQDLPVNTVLPLLIDASDVHFGLRFVHVRVDKVDPQRMRIHDRTVFDDRRPTFTGRYDLHPSQLGLKPGDRIDVWLEAWDVNPRCKPTVTRPGIRVTIVEPVSQAEAEDRKQQQEQDVKREQDQLEAKRPEQNEQAVPQPDQNPADAQPPATERRPEGNPQQPPPAQDPQQKPDGQDGQQQNGSQKGAGSSGSSGGSGGEKSSSGSQSGSGSGEKGTGGGEKPQGATGGSDASQKAAGQQGAGTQKGPNGSNAPPPGLKNDGSDDDRALQKALDHFRNQGGQTNGSEPPKSDSPKSDPANSGSNPQSGSPPGAKPTPDGQTPPTGATPPNGPQPTPNGQQPPQGQNPPNGQGAPNAQNPPSGQGNPNGQKPPQGQNAPNGSGTPNGTQPPQGTNPSGSPPNPAGNDPQSPNPNAPNPNPPNGASPERGAPNGSGANDPNAPKTPAGGANTSPMPPDKSGPNGAGANDPNAPQNPSGGGNTPSGNNAPSGNNTPAGTQAPDGGSGQGSPTQPKPGATPPGSGNSPPGGGSPSATPDNGGQKTPRDPQGSGSSDNGPQKPGANDGPATQSRPGTGDEQGPASAAKDPNTPSTQAKNPLERQPGEDPTLRDPADPNRPPMKIEPGTGTPPDSGTARPGATDKPNPQQPDAATPPGGPNDPTKPTAPRNTTNGQEPGSGKTQDPNGAPGAGQSPKSPTENGSSPSQGQQGTPGSSPMPGASQTPGAGKPSDGSGGSPMPGGSEGSSPQSGSPQSGSPAGGSSQPGGSQGAPSGSSESGSPQGSSGNQPGGASGGSSSPSPGTPGGRGEQPGRREGAGGRAGAGSRPGDGRGGPANGNGGAADGPPEQGDGGGPGSGPVVDEQANLENGRKAADLVLKRLEGQLERGEIDQELLDRLGWTSEDARRFADRLKKQIEQDPQGDSPENVAGRRQFEEMLKSLGVRSAPAARTGQDVRRARSDEIGPRNLPVPREYREAYEAYTRSLSKTSTSPKPPVRKP